MKRFLPFLAGAVLGVALIVLIGELTGFAMRELAALRLRAGLAFAALALSVLLARRRARGQSPARWKIRFMATLLATLSIGAFYSFGNPIYEGWFHRHDVFHYFLGARYAPELGYTGLYECTARAQDALGQREDVTSRYVRDLQNNSLVPGLEMLARPDSCTPRFSAARWQLFVADVGWFRSICDKPYWDQMQADHGYNPTPVWTLLGRALASLHAATWPFILALASLDVLLYVGMFAALGWAFGWRTLCVVLVFWGAQVPASHEWLVGNFLRMDWIFLLTLGVCCLRKRMFCLAGICIALSSLLRVFPAICLLGLAIVVAGQVWRQRRVPPAFVRFAVGGLSAAAVVLALAVGTLGTGYFAAFYDHIRVHERTPSANLMGAPMLLIQDFDRTQEQSIDPSAPDPLARWRALRQERLDSVRPLRWGLSIAMAIGLAFAALRVKRAWAVAPLSLVVLFTAAQLGCYYCIYFVLLVPLARLHHRIEWLVLGTAGLSAILATMPAFSLLPADQYTTQSVLYFAFCVALVAMLSCRRVRSSISDDQLRATAAGQGDPTVPDRCGPRDRTGSARALRTSRVNDFS